MEQHTNVLLGEQLASKTGLRGSNPRARACSVLSTQYLVLPRRRGATEKGAGFVSRFMLVRIQSSALLVPGVCRIRTRPCDGRRPGSIPGEDTEENDAGARRPGGCLQNSFQVGSTPTGVSYKQAISATWPAARRLSSFESARRVPDMGCNEGGI